MIKVPGPTQHVLDSYKFQYIEGPNTGKPCLHRDLAFDLTNLFPGHIEKKNENCRYIEYWYTISYADYEKYIVKRIDLLTSGGVHVCLNDLLSSFVITLHKELNGDGQLLFKDYFECFDDGACLQTYWKFYSMYNKTEYFNQDIIQELLDQQILVEIPPIII